MDIYTLSTNPTTIEMRESTDDLFEIGTIEVKNRAQFSVKVGVTAELAQAWATTISADPAVARWTQDQHKRSTPEEILERNKPGGEKNLVTYSIWNGEQLVAVAWYQIWKPGDAEAVALAEYCQVFDVPGTFLVTTSAFRVSSSYSGMGVGKNLVKLSEIDYGRYLKDKCYAEGVLFTLETDEKNTTARNLYVKLGYADVESFEQPGKEETKGKRMLMAKPIAL